MFLKVLVEIILYVETALLFSLKIKGIFKQNQPVVGDSACRQFMILKFKILIE